MMKGSKVYYYSKDGDTVPAEIIKMSKNKRRCKITNLRCKQVWVKVSNCELQSECV